MIKNIFILDPMKYGERITDTDWTVWVTHVDAYSVDLFCEDINWNQDVDGTHRTQIATVAAWIHL